MIQSLSPSLEDISFEFLDLLDRAKLSSTCKAATKLHMSEREYVRLIRERFVTTVPTFSGRQLLRYRELSFLHQKETGHSDAAFWFR